MRIYNQIEDFIVTSTHVGLTIGTFDGVHKGHQFILEQLRKAIGPSGQISVLTFTNHPSHVLRPEQSIPLLCTVAHKTKLFEQYGVDNVVIIPFSSHLSDYRAESFIEYIRAFIPFSHLVLGHDARLGKNRHGDKETMQQLAKHWQFEIQYLDPYKNGDAPISSTTVRQAIQKGNFQEAERLLGRPYSIYSAVEKGLGKGKKIGFPTANIDVSELCLPPLGVYAVNVICGQEKLKGVANLGIAPTLKTDQRPTLEVHLFSQDQDLYGKYVEVFFQKFLRPEKKFKSVEDLKKQIQIDVDLAKELLG